jgi:histidinol-phosphate aminotransferase
MKQLEQGFEALELSWIPSYGNFVSVEMPRADGVSQGATMYQRLLRAGVIVRPVGGYGMPDHLRVTVGRAEENARFLEALAAALGREN